MSMAKCKCEWEGYYDESPSNHVCRPPQTDEIPYSEWQSLGSKIADIILENNNVGGRMIKRYY